MGDAGRISATYDKEALLKCLLREARQYNVDVFDSHNVIGSRNQKWKSNRIYTQEGRSVYWYLCHWCGRQVVASSENTRF